MILLKRLFYLDLRSLALLRFSLGLLVFYDFLRRWQFSEVFYSDAGILKRSVLMAKFHHIWKPTLLFLNGTPAYAQILLVIGMITSLFYAFGVKTRLSNFIMWVLLISFHERFRISLNAGDILMTLMLFWSFFLPMNAVASWDQAWFSKEEHQQIKEDKKFANIFTVGWLSLIFFMYIFTFFFKWHPDWFKEGTTLYYALSLETFTTGLGRWLLNFPGLLKFLSVGTLWLEGIGPLLLLVPFRNHLFRYAMILSFWGLHLGIGATMTIGTFALCCCLLWFPVIPSEFWQWCEGLFKKKTPRETFHVYYDKDCGFCKRMVSVLVSLLSVRNVVVHSSEGDEKIHKKIIKENSWAGTLEQGETLYRWKNFLKLLEYSPYKPVAFLMGFIPVSIGDSLYNLVAGNRPFFTQAMKKIGHSVSMLRPNKAYVATGVLLLLLSFSYNLDGYSKKFRLPRNLKNFAQLIRLNQKWNMFAPYPTRTEGWLVVDGSLVDGTKVDPWRGGEVDFTRPKDMAQEYSNNVWRKVVGRIRSKTYKDYRLYFGKYICRTYNNDKPRGGKRLQSFKIYFMRDKTPPPGQESPPIKKYEIWSHACFKKTDWPG